MGRLPEKNSLVDIFRWRVEESSNLIVSMSIYANIYNWTRVISKIYLFYKSIVKLIRHSYECSAFA